MVSLHPADLTQQAICDALVGLALKSYGGIDVLYNNAAMAYFGWINEFTIKDYVARSTKTRDRFPVVQNRVAAPRGARRLHHQRRLHLSQVGLQGVARDRSYMAKGGVLAMTRQLAMEGGKHNIRANTISPD